MPGSKFKKDNFDELNRQLEGTLAQFGQRAYDQAKILWNGIYSPQPVAIVLCKNSGDVLKSLNFVRESNLSFSVKSGGHDYAGKSVIDDGLVIDLSEMNSVTIEPDQKKAIVGPGVTWGRFDEAAQSYGLATTGGTVSTVGVAGYTLGGGTGYLARKHGLALDNLLSAEVVTADGELVQTNKQLNPDLFWAIRGGGGNFGIVTSFEFRLHNVGPEITAGQVVYSFDDAGDVLSFYRNFIDKASDEVACYAFFLHAPPVDAFPEEFHGKTVLSLVTAHTGDAESAQEELYPLLHYGEPILKAVQPMPYTAAQQMFDEGMAKGNRWFSRAHILDSLSDDAIKTILNHTEKILGPFSVAYLEPLGGAINRVKTKDTAFPHRNSAFSFHIFAGWTEPDKDDEPIQWAKEFYHAMSVHTTGGVYVNLMSHDEQSRLPEAYKTNFARLADIKKKWDPDNLFRSNHNIEPN